LNVEGTRLHIHVNVYSVISEPQILSKTFLSF